MPAGISSIAILKRAGTLKNRLTGKLYQWNGGGVSAQVAIVYLPHVFGDVRASCVFKFMGTL